MTRIHIFFWALQAGHGDWVWAGERGMKIICFCWCCCTVVRVWVGEKPMKLGAAGWLGWELWLAFAGREGNGGNLFFLFSQWCGLCWSFAAAAERQWVVGWGPCCRRRRQKEEKDWRKAVVVDSVGRSLLRLGTRAQGSICLKEIVLRLGGLLYPCDESSFADR